MKGLLEHFELDGRVSSHEPIRDKPYQAEVEEVHTRYNPPQSARAYGTEYRDSGGSVRTDGFYPDPADPVGTRGVTTIYDAVSGTSRLIAQPEGLDHTFQIPRSAAELQSLLATQQQQSAADIPRACASRTPRRRHEPLGERIIEVLTCSGYRDTDEVSGLVCEHWFSKEYFIGLLYITKDAEGETVFRMFNLQLTEPDPDLFELRPDR